MAEVRDVVCETIHSVADEGGVTIGQIRGDAKLVEELGLRSLMMARLIAVLESRLDVDPFLELVAITRVRTVDDLCAAYEAAIEQSKHKE